MDTVGTLISHIDSSNLFWLLIKAQLILLAGTWLYTQLDGLDGRYRNLFLGATVLALVALPIINRHFNPPLTLELRSPFRPLHLSATSVGQWLTSVYFAGILFLMLRYCSALFRILKLMLYSKPMRHPLLTPPPRTQVRLTANLVSPVTWGTLKPIVLLPATFARWSETEQKMTLRHEYAHIQRRDWLWLLLGNIAAGLFWPLPAVHHCLRELNLEAEKACDRAVLQSGVAACDYAALLVKQVRFTLLRAGVALGAQSQLRERVHGLLAANTVWLRPLEHSSGGAIVVAMLLCPPVTLFSIHFIPGESQAAPAEYSSLNWRRTPSPIAVQEKFSWKPPSRPTTPELPPVLPLALQSNPGVEQPSVNTRPSIQVSVTTAGLNAKPLMTTDMPMPHYPRLAERQQKQGSVQVRMDINVEGLVENLRILKSSDRIFSTAVRSTLRQYRFDLSAFPHYRHGVRDVEVLYRFKLQAEQNMSDAPTTPPIEGSSHAHNNLL